MIPLSGDLAKAKGIKSESVDSIDVTKGTSTLKRGFAHMLKNGVVMDVTTVEQATDCRGGWRCFRNGIRQTSIRC